MKYAAFLRGINVGGKNKIKMKTLREVCSSLGFADVKTYINSGNVIFDTRKADNNKLAARIESAIENEFSLSIKVMVRSMDEIKEIIENNPFEGQFEREQDLHVFFLDKELPKEKCDQLLAINNENEMFAVDKFEIYLLLRISFAESVMARDYIANKLKVSATARNWRTVNKVAEI